MMYLEGKVQMAKVDNFFSGLELVVVDRQVVKPAGGRPQYTCRLIRGWQGLEELRTLKKKDGVTVQELTDFAQRIALPQEDQVLPLVVLDIRGKESFRTLICELAATVP